MSIVDGVAVNTRDTYSYANNTIFYSLLNETFRGFYNNTIRKAAYWLDGYDPSFHKNDILSTRIGAKLFNGFARSIFGRGLIFVKGKGNNEEKNATLNYVSHEWSKESNFNNAVKNLIGYTLPLGTSALKINQDGKGKLWVEPLRLDYFYFSCDGRKKVTSFTTFIRAFQSTQNAEENYFLVEKRYFEICKESFDAEINGKKYTFVKDKPVPYVDYKIFRYNGTVQNNVMPQSISGESENYNNLPDYVKKALKDEYGTIMVDKPKILPFVDYLGVELFFNEGGDITNPTLPFGRALCFDCLSDFMEYDLNKSYAVRDLFNSKGIVGVPKFLSQSSLIGKSVEGTANNLHELGSSSFGQLNIPGYELVDGLDPQTQKPIVTQFEMRVEEHEREDMKILKSIAITVGVSPRSIASFLVQDGEKTDDQIQSEDDTITQWIKDHRKDYIEGLNNIIECILNYEKKDVNVEVKFASDGLVKGDKQLEQIRIKLELGLITLEDAIRELNPDDDEGQLQIKIQNALAERDRKAQEQITEMDNEGNFPMSLLGD